MIVVLAAVAFARDLRVNATAANGHGHGVDRYAPWLLLAPVLAVALVAPPALGADAVVRTGAGNAMQAADLLPPLPPGTGVSITVGEFVQRAVWDAGRTLDDREVTLTGFAVRRGAAVDLARMTIVCAPRTRGRTASSSSATSATSRPTPGGGCAARCSPAAAPRRRGTSRR